MDTRPIGIFDSGIGGLTALKALREALPGEDIIYFGDSGRMPYGGRPKEELIHISGQDTAFLESMGCKAVVAACGTTSSNALGDLKKIFKIPLFGVIDDACSDAVEASVNKKILVLATEASIRTGAYEKGIHSICPEAEVLPLACPEFAPMVEQGHFLPGDEIAERAAETALYPAKDFGADTILLGCTHYPLLGDVLLKLAGEVSLISCGGSAIKGLRKFLTENGMLSPKRAIGSESFYTSGDVATFTKGASVFLGREIEAEFKSLE